MGASRQSSQVTQHHGQSGYSSQISMAAPPPYTPAKPPSLQTLIARYPIQHSLNQEETTRSITTHVMTDDTEYQYGENIMSPLKLCINTSINISKNNLVCLSDSLIRHANTIAEAVTQTLQKNSSGNCGIPMIHGNGNSRSIHIEVDAQGTVVGLESIVLEVLGQRDDLQQERDWAERKLWRQRDDGEKEPDSPAKRRRSD